MSKHLIRAGGPHGILTRAHLPGLMAVAGRVSLMSSFLAVVACGAAAAVATVAGGPLALLALPLGAATAVALAVHRLHRLLLPLPVYELRSEQVMLWTRRDAACAGYAQRVLASGRPLILADALVMQRLVADEHRQGRAG